MRRSLVILASMLAAACMSEAPGPRAEVAAVDGPRCLSVQDIIARRVVDDHTVAFDILGATYQADISQTCAAVARAPTLAAIELDVHGGDVCTGDFLRIIDPSIAAGSSAVPRCRIGHFSRVPAAPRS